MEGKTSPVQELVPVGWGGRHKERVKEDEYDVIKMEQ
jgi:hypothetical protein